jgi:hypothetical protein
MNLLKIDGDGITTYLASLQAADCHKIRGIKITTLVDDKSQLGVIWSNLKSFNCFIENQEGNHFSSVFPSGKSGRGRMTKHLDRFSAKGWIVWEWENDPERLALLERWKTKGEFFAQNILNNGGVLFR